MDTLNCCLVGYGGIAEFHAQACARIDGVSLRTVMGRRLGPAREFARRHGIARVTTDLGDALADPGLDAVILTSPSEMHHAQALMCLAAGKPVLVEIPLALSLAAAEEIAARSRSTGLPVMVAHTRRFDDVGRFVQDFLASGAAGVIHQHHAYSFWHRHQNVGWTGYRRSWVDDVVFHHGCHLVDFALWAVGAPVRRTRGEIGPKSRRNDTSMDVSLLIRFENETIATLSLSYNAAQGASASRFLCEKGVLEIAGKAVCFAGETVFETPDNPESGVLVQDREFFVALREARPPSCDAEAGVRALAPLQAAYDQMVGLEGAAKYQRRWEG